MSTAIKVDSNKAREAMAILCKNNHVTYVSKISESLGFKGNAVTNAIGKGEISTHMAFLLKEKYGVDVNDWAPDENTGTENAGPVYKAKEMIPIDVKKARVALARICDLNGCCSFDKLSRELGYSGPSLMNAVNKGAISGKMAFLLKEIYGANVKDWAPDPEPEPVSEPEPDPEPETVREEPQATRTDETKEQLDQLFARMDKMTELIEMFAAQMNRMDELINAVKSSRKQVDEETVCQGVKWGMEIFWRDYKKELMDMRNLKGAIFSGNLEAMKKHDEMLGDLALEGIRHD